MVFFMPAAAAGYRLDRPGCLMVRRGKTSAHVAVSEASLRGTEMAIGVPFGVDGGRLPSGVTLGDKPNVLNIAFRDGLQREFGIGLLARAQ